MSWGVELWDCVEEVSGQVTSDTEDVCGVYKREGRGGEGICQELEETVWQVFTEGGEEGKEATGGDEQGESF